MIRYNGALYSRKLRTKKTLLNRVKDRFKVDCVPKGKVYVEERKGKIDYGRLHDMGS